jgi:di/tricarboxylate transporter
VFGLVLVAVRVVRGFERSLPVAAATVSLTGVTAAAGLVLTEPVGVARNALVVAVVLALVGVSSALAAWMEQRRLSEPPVIEIAQPSRDGLARARNRPRVYR